MNYSKMTEAEIVSLLTIKLAFLHGRVTGFPDDRNVFHDDLDVISEWLATTEAARAAARTQDPDLLFYIDSHGHLPRTAADIAQWAASVKARPIAELTEAGIATGSRVQDIVGMLDSFLNLNDPRPAREQFSEHYRSEWSPSPGFTKIADDYTLQYHSPHDHDGEVDPPMKPLARMQFRDELILVYRYGMVAIVQKDDSFEVDRMD